MRIVKLLLLLIVIVALGVFGFGLVQQGFDIGATFSWIGNGFSQPNTVIEPPQDDFDALLDEFLTKNSSSGSIQSGAVNESGSITGNDQDNGSGQLANEGDMVLSGSTNETGVIISGSQDDIGSGSDNTSDFIENNISTTEKSQDEILDQRLKEYQEFKATMNGTGSYSSGDMMSDDVETDEEESVPDFIIETVKG